jgi:hypothetical protein
VGTLYGNGSFALGEEPPSVGIVMLRGEELLVLREDGGITTLLLPDVWLVRRIQSMDTNTGRRVEVHHCSGDPGYIWLEDDALLDALGAAVAHSSRTAPSPRKKTIETAEPLDVIARRRLSACTYLGGHGFGLMTGEKVALDFKTAGLEIRDHNSTQSLIAAVKYEDIEDLSITGPGTVTTGGGWMGGGHGLDGALIGAALAGVLNAISTESKVYTFIRLRTSFADVGFHYGGGEPEPLQLELSRPLERIRKANRRRDHFSPFDLISNLERLEGLRDRGTLHPDEFARLRDKLISNM